MVTAVAANHRLLLNGLLEQAIRIYMFHQLKSLEHMFTPQSEVYTLKHKLFYYCRHLAWKYDVVHILILAVPALIAYLQDALHAVNVVPALIALARSIIVWDYCKTNWTLNEVNELRLSHQRLVEWEENLIITYIKFIHYLLLKINLICNNLWCGILKKLNMTQC